MSGLMYKMTSAQVFSYLHNGNPKLQTPNPQRMREPHQHQEQAYNTESHSMGTTENVRGEEEAKGHRAESHR